MNILYYLSIFVLTQSTWITYTSKNPAFVVKFPSEIQEKEKIVETEIGAFYINTVYCVSSIDSTENELYLLNFYPIDNNLFLGDSAMTKSEYLDLSVDNIADNIKGKVLYSNKELNDNVNSITYRLDMDNGQKSMKGKIIIANGYFFSLQVFTQKQYSLNKNMDKFIDSFYLK